MYKEDTIAAIATSVGEGGIGIVRVSGRDAERIANEIFQRNNKKNGRLRSHMLYYGTIRDPQTHLVMDEVLLALMRKPHSYTGEDVVEVNCHGGPLLLRRILGLVLSRGARQAEPGEFTKRAFLNGRLDLAQAEAVLDLIKAQTERGVSLAVSQIRGELSEWIGELKEGLLSILVQIEAAIDFSEEEIELVPRRELLAQVEALRGKIRILVDSYEWGRLFREGAKVCIFGRPNVGKSSLFNALLGAERVIVTEIPGTTRDVVEESINLGGLPIVLWDTAGIRDTDDRIESIGVGLSKRYLQAADAAVLVLDGSEPLTPEDFSLIAAAQTKKLLVLVNKQDLPLRLDLANLRAAVDAAEVLHVSTKQGSGLEQVQENLRSLLVKTRTEPTIALTNERHRAALIASERALEDAVVALSTAKPPEIIAVNLQEARDALEEIVGAITSDDILERIFANFCLGK
jgi:tRNA modification GTPase